MRLPWSVLLACPAVSALDTSGSGRQAPPQLAARQEQLSNPSVETFIRRFHPSTTKIGNKLIVDGGSISRLNNGSHQLNAVNITLSIPLDSSWTNASLVMTEISRTLLPSNNAPILWADEESGTVYTYGGDSIGKNSSYTGSKQLFKLRDEPSSQGGGGGPAWTTADVADPFAFSQLYNPARSAYAACNGVGFSLGGYANSGTDDRFAGSDGGTYPLPGLVTWEFATRNWANRSIAAAFDPQLHGYYPAGGAAVCLPTLGKSGMVMFLGGEAIAANGKDKVPVQFDKMTFYDIASGEFRTQSTTTGDGLPEHRRDFCATANRGKNGSYEVFVFGGRPASGESNKARADMWVLSIPGFRWFKAAGPAAYLDQGRAFTSCAAVGRQLVVVGGVAEQSNKQWTVAQTDPWSQGVGVFDMQELGWRDGYKHDMEAYDTPEVVKTWYRDGGVANWDQAGMEQFFSEAASSPAPAPTPEPGNSSSSGSGGLSQGATIGIAVGVSILGLIIIAALVWFCIRRRRAATHNRAELAGDNGTVPGTVTGSDPTLTSSTFVGGSSPSPGIPAGGTVSPWSKSELAASDAGNGMPQGYQPPPMQEYYGQGQAGMYYPPPHQQPGQRPAWAELPGQELPRQPYEVSAHPPSAPGGAYPVHELRG